jgi:hypothetical protein
MKTHLIEQTREAGILDPTRPGRISRLGRIGIAVAGACAAAVLTGCVAVPAGGYSDSYYYNTPAPAVAPSVYYQESYYGGGGGYYGARPYYGGAPVYVAPAYDARVDYYRRGGRDRNDGRYDRDDRGRPGQGVRPGRPGQPPVAGYPGRPPQAGGGRPGYQGGGQGNRVGPPPPPPNPYAGSSVQQGNN